MYQNEWERANSLVLCALTSVLSCNPVINGQCRVSHVRGGINVVLRPLDGHLAREPVTRDVKGSHRVLPFWLLIASLVGGAAMPLMQYPITSILVLISPTWCILVLITGRMTG